MSEKDKQLVREAQGLPWEKLIELEKLAESGKAQFEIHSLLVSRFRRELNKE